MTKKIENLKLPSVNYRYNPSLILSNVLENRLRKIKMVLGRVTPTTRWTEIGGCDYNGAR